MSRKLFTTAAAIVATAFAAGSANATVLAAWDFAGLSVAGESVTGPIAPAVSAGGTPTATVGSGTVTAGAMPPGLSTTNADGLQGGLTAGDAVGGSTFGLLAPAAAPGAPQLNGSGSQYLGLTTQGAATVEFEVPSGITVGDGLRLSFGATAIFGSGANNATTAIDVSFGDTCGATAPVGTAVVGVEDTEVIFALGVSGATGGCVVFDLDGTDNPPLIDNVALVSVPEPGMLGGIAAGLLGLMGLARRREA
jgi:hypothetical protein